MYFDHFYIKPPPIPPRLTPSSLSLRTNNFEMMIEQSHLRYSLQNTEQIYYIQMRVTWAGEVAEQLRALVALPEELGSDTGTHVRHKPMT